MIFFQFNSFTIDSISFLVNPMPGLASRLVRIFPFSKTIKVGTILISNLSQSGVSSSSTRAVFFSILSEVISSKVGLK